MLFKALMIYRGNLKEKTGNGLSTSNYGIRQNTSDRKAKKSMFSKMDSLKVCSVVICATIFLKVSTIDCLSNHTSETTSTTTTTPTPSTSGEYFASILRMKELAVLEQSMVDEMYEVVKTGELQQEGLSKIKTYLFDYDSSIQPMLLGTVDVATGVSSHPLISYRTLRRIAFSLPDILQYNVEGRLENLAKLAALIQPAVNGDDVIGAMEGILRLQATFLISPQDFAHGRLHNFDTKSGLTEMDCFLFGNIALNEKKQPSTAIEWFVQALRMLLRMDVNDSSGMILMQIVRYSLRNAIEMHNKVINQNPWTFTKAVEINLSDMTLDTENELLNKFSSYPSLQNHLLLEGDDEINFRALCRGEKLRDETLTKNLNCYYKTDNPFLVIKPLKVEIHSYDPLVLQFYDFMPESIVNHLVYSSSYRLQRALVTTDYIGSKTLSTVRTACNAWIDDKSDQMLSRVPKIIHEATSLNLISDGSSEPSQIATYGAIGGFYGPHHDNIQDHLLYDNKTYDDATISRGDRIATILFYLSDLKLGGGTAFTRIGALAQPIKGSAVFWYNLKKNGKRHEQTMHGGCPVLLGEKWVVNKWIRSGDQMFLRKCSLDSNI